MGVRAQTTHMKKVMKMTIYECVTNTTWAALRHTGHVLRGCKTMIVSPGGSVVDNPPAMCRTQVWSLGQEDLLEKEIATHSSILAWEILWTEGLGGLQSMGSQSWTQFRDQTTKRMITGESGHPGRSSPERCHFVKHVLMGRKRTGKDLLEERAGANCKF